MRVAYEVWEYTGPIGGANEFIVRLNTDVTTIGATPVDTVIPGVNNIDDVVPFITGVTNTGTGRTWDDANHIATIVDTGSTTLRLERGGVSGTATVDVAVVEFTGSNWIIQNNISHTPITGGTTESEIISTVSSWDNAFVVSSHMSRNGAAGLDESGWNVWPHPTNTDELNFRMRANSGSFTSDVIVAHIVENPLLSVTHIDSITGSEVSIPSASNTQIYSITPVANLTQSGTIATADAAGGGTAYPRQFSNYQLTAEDTLEFFRGRSGQSQDFAAQIIEFPLNATVQNFAPILTPIGNQNITEGQTLIFEINATDVEPFDSLLYSATGLPGFAALVNNGDDTATFTATPGFADEGVYNINVTVSDNGIPSLIDFEEFTLTVVDAPTLTSDFKVQRGDFTFTGTTGTITSVASADFDVCTGDCFIKTVNTRNSGTGDDVGGGSQDPEDWTIRISDVTGLTSPNTIHLKKIWEHYHPTFLGRSGSILGLVGGPNEIQVLDQNSCNFAASATSCIGTTASTSNNDDVVVFITGVENTANTRTNSVSSHLITSDFDGSEFNFDPEVGDKQYTYFWFTVWTATGDDIQLQFKADNAGDVITADQVTITAIELVPGLEYLFDENTLPTTLDGSWSSTNNAQVTFTPTNNNEDWLVLTTSQIDPVDEFTISSTRLQSNGTGN
ncbi:MAG: hypothetical protein HRO68_07050 [Nitrosopumilus sp.]|nr:hypothetical protein [Nitrosopumilus sp.]